MNKPLQKIIEETQISPELYPIDFFYADVLKDKKNTSGNPPEIFVERYNQKFIKVKNSHRPVSKILQSEMISKMI